MLKIGSLMRHSVKTIPRERNWDILAKYLNWPDHLIVLTLLRNIRIEALWQVDTAQTHHITADISHRNNLRKVRATKSLSSVGIQITSTYCSNALTKKYIKARTTNYTGTTLTMINTCLTKANLQAWHVTTAYTSEHYIPLELQHHMTLFHRR